MSSKRNQNGPQHRAPSVNDSLDDSQVFNSQYSSMEHYTEIEENKYNHDHRHRRRRRRHDAEENPIVSALGSHFSTLTVTAMVILLSATVLLFIWSNSSVGAWVRLQVIPNVNISNINEINYQNGIFSSYLKDIITLYNNFELNSIENANNSTDISNISKNIDNNNNDLLELVSELYALKTSNTINNKQSIINKLKNLKLDQNVFHFTLIGSCKMFYHSNAMMLAILVGFFSGLWPYIKLVLLAFCWLWPMNQKRREKILFFLDQLGKFSFIDLFVTITMTVSFYVKVNEAV